MHSILSISWRLVPLSLPSSWLDLPTDFLQSILKRSHIGRFNHAVSSYVSVVWIRVQSFPVRGIIPPTKELPLTVLPVISIFPRSIQEEIILHE